MRHKRIQQLVTNTKHPRKHFLKAVLLTAFFMFALTACAPNNESTNVSGETRIITDGTGRTVEIPTEVRTIVPLGNTPRMVVYLESADKIVGIESCEITETPLQTYAYSYREAWSELPNCGTNAKGETAYNPEEILRANPDVILCTDPADAADDLQAQTGIPVVAVSSGTLFGEDYEESLRILGDVLDASERAESIIDYVDRTLEDLENRMDASDADTPTVLAAGATFKGMHGIDGIYVDYPVFDILDAEDVAADLENTTDSGGITVDKEQIAAWNPEFLFFDAGSLELLRTEYRENPSYFRQLRAVREGNLYQWPNSTYHYSNVEIPLVSAYYTGSLLRPEAFRDIDLEEKASEIFDFFLNDPDYLNTLEDAGFGYRKVRLDETV